MKGERTRKGTSDGLTARQIAQIERLKALPDDQIDTSDIPEILDWSGAKRGLFYRPVKRQITLRIDTDVIDWFKRRAGKEKGYQTNMNRVLRDYVARHRGKP